MSDGVDDERKHAAFRDRYGKVAYEAAWRGSTRDPHPAWEAMSDLSRRYWSDAAEAVVDAFVTGDLPARTPGGGT